jgi:hypothetical protein
LIRGAAEYEARDSHGKTEDGVSHGQNASCKRRQDESRKEAHGGHSCVRRSPCALATKIATPSFFVGGRVNAGV